MDYTKKAEYIIDSIFKTVKKEGHSSSIFLKAALKMYLKNAYREGRQEALSEIEMGECLLCEKKTTLKELNSNAKLSYDEPICDKCASNIDNKQDEERNDKIQ